MKMLWKIVSGVVCVCLLLLFLKHIFIDIPERSGQVTPLVEMKRKVVSSLTGKEDTGQFRKLGKDEYKRAYRLAQEAQKDIYDGHDEAALENLTKASSILKRLVLEYPEWEYREVFEQKLKDYDTQIVAIMMARLQAEPVDKTAMVSRVYDGDTVLLTDNITVRYIGMNTPERGDPLYGEARKMNQELVGGKKIELRYGEERQDIHGRTLAYVFCGGKCVNAELVKEGLARKYIFGRTKKYDLLFDKLEQLAMMEEKGLWKKGSAAK